MNAQTAIHPKVRFFDAFKVEADSLAAQRVIYNEENDMLSYDNPEPYGETAVVRVELRNPPFTSVLELENRNENELVDELSDLFAKLDYDVTTFTIHVQAQYREHNKI